MGLEGLGKEGFRGQWEPGDGEWGAQWEVEAPGAHIQPPSAPLPQVCSGEPTPGGLLFCLRRVDVWGDAVGDVLWGQGALGLGPALPHPAAAGEGPSPAA